MKTPQPQYYLGVIKKILDPDTYEVEIEIPGVTKDAKAYPYRDTVDEPKPEDLILVLGLDPEWHSVWLYQKLKENDFIGFRARGKMIRFEESKITIGKFDSFNSKDQSSPPYPEDTPPTCGSYIEIDKSGNLTIVMESNSDITIKGSEKIEITGSSEVTIGGDSKIQVSGSANINVGSSTTLTCPDVKITGGTLTTPSGGTCGATGTGGFCGIPVCPVTGAPHVGNKISGT